MGFRRCSCHFLIVFHRYSSIFINLHKGFRGSGLSTLLFQLPAARLQEVHQVFQLRHRPWSKSTSVSYSCASRALGAPISSPPAPAKSSLPHVFIRFSSVFVEFSMVFTCFQLNLSSFSCHFLLPFLLSSTTLGLTGDTGSQALGSDVSGLGSSGGARRRSTSAGGGPVRFTACQCGATSYIYIHIHTTYTYILHILYAFILHIFIVFTIYVRPFSRAMRPQKSTTGRRRRGPRAAGGS